LAKPRTLLDSIDASAGLRDCALIGSCHSFADHANQGARHRAHIANSEANGALVVVNKSKAERMSKKTIFASATLVAVLAVLGPAAAQVAPQTVELAKVNVQKLAAGYRASKVIGSSVANDANETIGKIVDLLVSSDGKDPYAVLSSEAFSAWAVTWWRSPTIV
jgi:hypothetical protein